MNNFYYVIETRPEIININMINFNKTRDMSLFNTISGMIYGSNTEEALAAVAQNPFVALQSTYDGWTLLMSACNSESDNPQLVQFLLKKGANVNAQNKDGWNALMWASAKGYISTCAILLEHGANPDYRIEYVSAFMMAAREGYLQICLLFISYNADLMMVVRNQTVLDWYGYECSDKVTSSERKEHRNILLTAFDRQQRWNRRWPIMNVIFGCEFRILDSRIKLRRKKAQHCKKRREALRRLFLRELEPVLLDTPKKRCAYYMRVIFECDDFLWNILSFL